MVGKWTGAAILVYLAVTMGAAVAGETTGSVKHPVLRHNIDPERAAGYESAVRRVMAMSEAEMLDLVPAKSCILFCGCPNCSGGQQENGQFEWTIERPLELVCKFCGHVYPSEEYPMNRTATGVNALGETVTYKYFLDESSGRDFWFEACADRLKRGWFVGQCQALATCYHVTRKEEYARRAALILNRFAEAYPHMAVLSQWPYRRRAVAKPTPPYPSAGGKWGRWMAEEVPHGLPEAYDLIHASPELDKLSQELGTDVRRRIENDFFRATVEYTFTFGKEPTGEHLNNMAPFYTRNIVQIGRVIGEPEYVHWGYRWVGEILRDKFFYDGMWHEAPAYHYQTIGGISRVIAALEGYSDPPGYRSSADGLRLEAVDLQRQLPFVGKAIGAPAVVAYPNGRICPAHDTWATSRTSPPREQTASTLLPGFGQASLGRGTGADQLQAQLHFSGGYGHEHADNLSFSLFAKGAEMFSDIGYSHTKLRRWTISTVGHNTVAVDRREQSTGDSDGDLMIFLPDAAGLCVVEARGQRAYPQLVEMYRRQLLLVPVSATDAYVVDVFRLRGGSVHDWLLHGSADDEMTAECSLPLVPREGTLLEPGEQWVEPVGESSPVLPYGLIRQLREAETGDSFHVTFRYAGAEGATAGAGVRVHLLGEPSTEVFLGSSPQVRPAEGDDRKVYDHWMPQLVVRRSGEAPLAGVFAAVHEPFRPEPFLGDVLALPLEESDDYAVALKVPHGDLEDTIVSTLDEPPYPERRLSGGIRFQGRLGVLRERAGKVVAAWLVDGISLGKGDFVLTCEAPRWEGTIESATRKADGAAADSFVTTAELPPGDALAGRWMIVTHAGGHTHGYEINAVAPAEGKSVILLRDDHGLRIADGTTEECYFPRRKIPGPNRFIIPGWTARQPGE
ncbi:MAG: heparinase II/III family protein [Planctomycetota bacterium]